MSTTLYTLIIKILEKKIEKGKRCFLSKQYSQMVKVPTLFVINSTLNFYLTEEIGRFGEKQLFNLFFS